MKKLLNHLLLSASLFLCINARAQTQLTGRITNDQQQGVEGASVQLLRPADSSLLKLTLSKKDGSFSLTATSFPVLLKIMALNYSSHIQVLDKAPTAMVQVQLKNSSGQLTEVQVRSSRPLLQFYGDKTVMNIDAAPSNAGNTMLDILQKLPDVLIDQDGNISINGKSGTIVMIDGRETFLSGQQLLNLLRNMPAANNDQLEIISNPSARYDASFTGGILNIKSKKSLANGFNGTLSVAGGTVIFEDINGAVKGHPLSRNNLNWNYRKNRVNLYGNMGYDHGFYFENFKTWRYFESLPGYTPQGSYFSWSNIKTPDNSYTFRVGADINLSQYSVLGILANNNYSTSSSKGSTYSYLANNADQIHYQMQSGITNPGGNDFFGNYNLNYKYDHPKKNIEFNTDLSMLTYNSRAQTSNETFFTDTLNNTVIAPLFRKQDARNRFEGWVYKADLVIKKIKGVKAELGYKYSFIETINDPLFQRKQGSTYEVDRIRTTYFRYSDAIHAGYLILSKKINRFELQSGVRLESAKGKGYQQVNDSSFRRSWLNLFPSFYVKYNASAKYQLILNYTSKIIRPTARHLSPFTYMTDSLYSNTGNPFIQPQFAHALEWRNIINNRISITGTYQYTKDMILMAVYQDPALKTTRVSFSNFRRYQVFNISTSVPLKPAAYWQINLSNTIGFTSAQGILFAQPVSLKRAYWNMVWTNNFSLSSLWGADLNFSYGTPQLSGLLTLYRPVHYSIGIRKKTRNNLGNFTLSMQNPFFIPHYRFAADYANTSYHSRFSNVNQQFILSYSVRFGKQTIAQQRVRRNAADEEQGRL